MLGAMAAGLTIQVKDKASASVRQIGRAFEQFRAVAERAGKGLGMIAQGLGKMKLAGLALGAGLGFGAKKAMDFEAQMSAVRSVMQGVTAEQFAALTEKAKDLGATTSKSATQAAEGAELLARAGFSAGEVMSALGPTIRAAEADSIDLATAANLVANNVRAFGLNAAEAERVANVLAVTSAKTNTNMTQLGEGMKFVAPVANQLGIDIEDTSAALGLLANAGLQGTIGGTALKNMLLKLTDPTDEVRKQFIDMGIAVQTAEGNMLPLPQLVGNIAKGMHELKGNMKQSAFMAEAFGIRGQAAAANLTNAFGRMQEMVSDPRFGNVTQWELLQLQIRNSAGAAEEMAKIRLANLRGAFVLLSSAIEAVSVEFFTDVLKAATPGVNAVARGIARMAEGMRNYNKIVSGEYIATLEEADALNAQQTERFLQIGVGLKEAANSLTVMMEKVNEYKLAAFDAFGESSATVRWMTKWGTLSAVGIAAIGGIGAAAAFAFGPVISGLGLIAGGLGTLLVTAWPVTVAFGLIAGMLMATAAEGETFTERLERALFDLKTFWDQASTGFWQGYTAYIEPAFTEFKIAGLELWAALQPALETLGMAFGDATQDGVGFGRGLAAALAGVVRIGTGMVKMLTWVSNFVIKDWIAPLLRGFRQIIDGFTMVARGGDDMKKGLIMALKGTINLLLNTVFRPLKFVMLGTAYAMETLFPKTADAAKTLRNFLNAEDGTLLGRNAEDIQRDRESREESRAAAEARAAARERARAERPGDPNVEVVTPAPKVTASVNTTLEVDGKTFSRVNDEQEAELAERGGFRNQPWQRGAATGLPAGAR